VDIIGGRDLEGRSLPPWRDLHSQTMEPMHLHNFICERGNDPVNQTSQMHQDCKLSMAEFDAAMEKKIERACSNAMKLSWKYDDFVIRLLDVLVILHDRNKVRQMTASKTKG
jgi:hypothetical protein